MKIITWGSTLLSILMLATGCKTEGEWSGAWSSPATAPYPLVTGLEDINIGSFNLLSLVDSVLAPGTTATGRSFRTIIKPSIGGNQVRLRFSNVHGTHPLVIEDVNIATAIFGAVIADDVTDVLFSHQSRVEIPPGAELLSDPVVFSVNPDNKLAVSFDVVEQTGPITWHSLAWEISYVSLYGIEGQSDRSGFPFIVPTMSTFFLSGLEVRAPDTLGTVVVLGDSITEGVFHVPGSNKAWPDFLAERFREQNIPYGVLNQGVSANRVLEDERASESALKRFDRDVIDQTNVKSLIILEGTNDLGSGQQAAEIFAGILALAMKARELGICVTVSTITPRADWFIDWDNSKEQQRRLLNQMIIANSDAFDVVVDLSSVLSDPFWPEIPYLFYYSPDLLHPLPTGFQAMANAIPVSKILPPPHGECGPKQ